MGVVVNERISKIGNIQQAKVFLLGAVIASGYVIDSQQFARWQKELVRHGHLDLLNYTDNNGQFHFDRVLTRAGLEYLTKTISKVDPLVPKIKASTAILAAIYMAGNLIDATQIMRWQRELIGEGYLERDNYMDKNGQYHWDLVLTRIGLNYFESQIKHLAAEMTQIGIEIVKV